MTFPPAGKPEVSDPEQPDESAVAARATVSAPLSQKPVLEWTTEDWIRWVEESTPVIGPAPGTDRSPADATEPATEATAGRDAMTGADPMDSESPVLDERQDEDDARRSSSVADLDEPAPTVETRGEVGGKPSSTRTVVEWVLIIGGALLAALVIKTFLFQAFYIPSESMLPTLEKQDRVLVNKLSYRLHEINRGDVVVFERPPNEAGVIRDLIKRVVGLPGETVEGRDGRIYINGQALREPYLPPASTTSTFGPKDIPADHIWVMGDNRSNSSDSRVFGSISTSSVVGRAFVRVWPLNALDLL